MWCRLEIFVGLASFTGCLVSVDKLYLFYSTCFYKAMAYISCAPVERKPPDTTLRLTGLPPQGRTYDTQVTAASASLVACSQTG